MWLASHRDPDGLVCQEERYILDTKDDGLILCRYWQDSQFTTIHQIISKWVGHDATVNVSKNHGICYHGFPPEGASSCSKPGTGRYIIHISVQRPRSLVKDICVLVFIFKHGPPTDVNCFFLPGKIIWHQTIFSDSANRRLIPGIGKNHQKPVSIFQFYPSRTESVYLRPSNTTIMLGSQTNLDLCRENGNQPTKKLVKDHEILELPAGYARWISKSQSGKSLSPWFKPLGCTPVSSIFHLFWAILI